MQEISKIIRERYSARVPFDPKHPIAERDLEQILEAARWAPTAHNMQNFEIIAVDDREILGRLGKIRYPIDAAFVRENYPMLSFSEKELIKKKIGILGTFFPPFMKSPSALTYVNRGDKDTETVGKFASACAVMLVVVYDPEKRAPASEGDFFGVIGLGCVLENMWLTARSLGIGFHVFSVLGDAPVEKEAKKILNIPGRLKIAFALRLGYPVPRPAKYLRVRRDVRDFTHINRFGSKCKEK